MNSFKKLLGFLFFALIVLPILFFLGFFNLLSIGLERVGLSAEAASLVLLLAVAGSFVNIPLSKKKVLIVEQPYFFGFFKRRYAALQGISINVGGAIIPLILSSYFVFHLGSNLLGVVFAILCVTVISKISTKYIPGKGVALSPFLVAFFAVVISFLFAPGRVAQAAFVSGTLGVLLGADLLNLPKILTKGEAGMLCIGGAGVFDAVFLIGILSALIAGF